MRKVNSTQKLGAVALACLMLSFTFTGCTASQVNTVVSEINSYLPTAVSLLNEAITIYQAVATPDAKTASVTSALTTVQSDLTAIQTLLSDYLASTASSSAKTTAWTNIKTAIDTAVTDVDSLLIIAAVKNSDTKATGLTVIAALDAAVHVIDGYVSSTQSPAEVNAKAAKRTVKLRQVSQYWSASDKQEIARAAGVPYSVALAHAEAAGF